MKDYDSTKCAKNKVLLLRMAFFESLGLIAETILLLIQHKVIIEYDREIIYADLQKRKVLYLL